MGTESLNYIERLESAPAGRGNPISVDTFLDVLKEANDSVTEQLSVGERE